MRTTTDSIDNSADIIDSRDVIARIEALESEREDALGDEPTPAQQQEWDDSDEAAELKALQALASEAEGYAADWYPVALIRDSYFEDYARELADDIGAIDPKATWPLNCIDWEAAAEMLQQDYTSVEFGGVTYWIR